MNFVVSFIAVVFLFVIVLAIIKMIENHKRNKLLADLYVKALEKGEKLPEDLLQPKKKNSSLKTGIIMTSISVGIILMIALINPQKDLLKSIASGLVPLFVGIGFLIVHFVFKKQGLEENED